MYLENLGEVQLKKTHPVCVRPPQKIVFSGFMSAPCNHEFLRVIEIYGKNYRSIGQPKVSDQDPPVFTTHPYNTLNKSSRNHANLGVQTSATVW